MKRYLSWCDGLLIAFVVVAVIVRIVGTDVLDVRLSVELQRWTSADRWMHAASWLGGQPINIVEPIVAISLLVALGSPRDAGFLLASVGGSALLQYGAKLVVDRARPAAPVLIETLTTGASFPSGHVMEYLALFGFAAVIARVKLRPSPARTALLALLIALVCVVGPSRVYLGAHFTTDVIGAYLIGLWWLSVCARVYHGTPRRG